MDHRKTSDDILVERACGILSLSKFEFFARAMLWDRSTPNPQQAAVDYNVYEQSDAYPAYVLGYADCVVRTENTKTSTPPPFTNVRSIRSKTGGVADLNLHRAKRKPGDKS